MHGELKHECGVAAVEKPAHPGDIGLDVNRETVRVGVYPATEQLAQPRHLDPGRARLAAITVEVGGELLARHARATRGQEREHLGVPRAEPDGPSGQLDQWPVLPQQAQLEDGPPRRSRLPASGGQPLISVHFCCHCV